jgi:DtxR family transcriptional regulator, Mn-dependent transcriptional regulator
LIEKLDAFLGFPKIDPHGDPIPDQYGVFEFLPKKLLSDIEVGAFCEMLAVKDNSAEFLNFATELGLSVDQMIQVKSKQTFDSTMEIVIGDKINRISLKFAQNIYVK